MQYLSPRVDFAFKKLFGVEENKDILISFINAVVSKENQIEEITLLNPFNHKNYALDKLSILDIKAQDKQGRQYDIEMQVTDEVYYNQRSLYYWSRLYTDQLKAGQTFDNLRKTISINILNFNFFNEEEDYHNIFRILNVKSHRSYFDDLELHFIELEKFNKDLGHLKTALDRWTTFLKKAGYYKDHIPAELRQDQGIIKAIKALNTLNLTKEEMEIYEAQLKWFRDEAAALKTAEIKGIVKGLEKGLKQIVDYMFAQGKSIEVISESTGIPIEKIKSMQGKVLIE